MLFPRDSGSLHPQPLVLYTLIKMRTLPSKHHYKESRHPLILELKHSETFVVVIVVYSIGHIWFFTTLWTATCQAPLSSTISQSLPKFMSTESMIPSVSSSAICFSFCHQSFLALDLFPKNQLFTSSGQSIGASASASVLLMNIKDWFPSGLTSLVFQSKRLSRVSSHATVQKHRFFSAQSSLWPS